MRSQWQSRGSERGVTILEVLIASVMLVVVAIGFLGLFLMSVSPNKSQGEIMMRTTEYSQDKMEQLLALQYSDPASDTLSFPTASSGGSGLAVGGSTTLPGT